MPLQPDFVAELRKHFTGDIRPDLGSRILYSTDASIYQIEPLGVALPRTQEDLQAAVELAAKYRLPVLPRGGGTSLAGQAIGEALILDCSRWLDHILEMNVEARTATVEPGVILAGLNRAAAGHGLTFGPDPASAERATMGGVIANNATGAHSILYGMAADHIRSADVIMADGSPGTFGEIAIGAAAAGGSDALISRLTAAALHIRERNAEAIRARYPKTWRNSAGYRLNYLLPWASSRPPRWGSGQSAGNDGYPPAAPGYVNLATLLAGSEGTLAVMRRITVSLVQKPKHTVLAVLAYASVAAACDDVPRLLGHDPSAVELIPRMLIRLARGVPAYAAQVGWATGDPAALLVVEFSGNQAAPLEEKARRCGPTLRVATTPNEQNQIWGIRKAGLGLLDAAPVASRPVAFIEDCAVPVERLGEFVREVEKILSAHSAEAAFYAHASAGCLHIRPMLDLRTGSGVLSLRSIAEAVLQLTLRLGGVMSSEHGDGLARSEWLEQEYGDELIGAMRELKQAADPHAILNPGKIIDAPAMDAHLRFGADYHARDWSPNLDFSRSGGLRMGIEQCNGQGVCRKPDGVMCPSFQATREEMNSTRGRANLLRALVASPTTLTRKDMEEIVHEALDLCLACKGCKAECPSGVDMAKLKFAFDAEYYKTHRRPPSDFLFGYFDRVAALLAPTAPIANAFMGSALSRQTISRITGIAAQRPLPRFSRARAQVRAPANRSGGQVIFLSDAFTHFIEPQVEQAAFDVLGVLGLNARVLPARAAGAALLSKGFLGAARRHAGRVLAQITQLDPDGTLPVLGLEPPEIYCLKNDYFDLLPERSEEISRVAERVWLLDEFLIRSDFAREVLRMDPPPRSPQKVKFQPHCHQRAEPRDADGYPTGVAATVALLNTCGFEVEVIEAGCCGMAGTFGYEADHYELSQKIGELRLFPIVREKGDALLAATGAACRLQITQGTGTPAAHPVEMVAQSLGLPTVGAMA
jgi:FAD/FMN-containing dehydrogenase/Fe-S oxidoreductase